MEANLVLILLIANSVLTTDSRPTKTFANLYKSNLRCNFESVDTILLKMEKCEKCYKRYEHFMENRFERLGSFISYYPKSIMGICVVVNIVCLIGFMNLSVENDVEVLYTPSNSQAYKDREFLKSVYSDPTTSNFESYQLSSFGRYVDIMIVSKNKSNIMNQQYVNEINSIDSFIRNSIVVGGTGSLTYRFIDVCAVTSTGCFVLGNVFLNADFQQQFINRNVSYPLHNSELLSPLFASAVGQNGKLVSTIGIKLRYYLRQNSSISETWENAFLTQIINLQTNTTDFAYANSESLQTELDKATNSDIKFFSLTFTIMMTYACLASASSWIKCNNIANRMNLGIAGVIAPVLGIGAALGFIGGIGVKFTNIVGVMPFLIIGIGIDDMFILMSGMAGAPSLLENNTVKDRMKYMLKKSGISITITSITDLLAFGIGASSVFISIRNFCLYTGMAVIFCYLNQLFFLSPAICLNEKRTLKERHFCVCCLKAETREISTEKKNLKYKCMSGNIPKSRDDVESFLEEYPKKITLKILSHIVGKIFVCLLFLSYVVSSIYGTVFLKQGLLLFNLVSQNSYFHTYSTWENNYFTTETVIAMCIKDENTYSLQSTQSQISNIITQAKLDEGIDDTFEINWLKAYQQSALYDNSSEANFVSGLKTFLINAPRFSNDIIFDNSKLTSTKFYVKSINLKSSDDQGSLMERLREISKESTLSFFFYTPAFIFYEQYVQILDSTLLTVGIAFAVILVVTFIFMPQPLVVIIVAFTVLSIITGIFGFMYYWDLTLSSITMIHLVMSVGFSVDFTVHICHSFLSVRSEKDVLKKALDKSGGPVFNAAFSSLLGIFMLFFSESYIFQSFGKVMFLVVFFGLVHAVFFLPLLMNILIHFMQQKSCCSCRYRVDAE